MLPRIGLALALLGTLLFAASCTTWSKTSMPPQAGAAQDEREKLRIQLKDGRFLTVEHAGVVGDSLVGEMKSGRVAVALTDIQDVEERRFNVLITAMTVGFLAGICIVLGASGSGEPL